MNFPNVLTPIYRQLHMWRHSDRVIPTVENHKLGFEHDITINLEVSRDSLNTTETSYKESVKFPSGCLNGIAHWY